MANVTRTLYTQGEIILSGLSATLGSGITGASAPGSAGLTLSGIQSVNFSVNTPQTDVNAFGVLGTIDKVQLEPTASTIEVSMIMANAGGALNTNWLSGLANDATQPNPSGLTVIAKGVGRLDKAIMSTFTMEAAVGALPTLSFTLEGNSGAFPTAAAAPTQLNTLDFQVVIPSEVQGVLWADAANSGCPQSVRASWEMPVERINCLGNDINDPTIFSRPPGSVSYVAEGVDSAMKNNYVTGITIGPYSLISSAIGTRVSSRTNNMAVGEVGATLNVTSENIAWGAVVLGS